MSVAGSSPSAWSPSVLIEALGLYERIAVALLRDAAYLDWLTLLPSSRVQTHLRVLSESGLIELSEPLASSGRRSLVLPAVETLSARVRERLDPATWSRVAALQAYWASHRPVVTSHLDADGGEVLLHGAAGYWAHWWHILCDHHDWPEQRPVPRDAPLGLPPHGPLTMDALLPSLPGFAESPWLENLDRALLARLRADDWLRIRLIVPRVTAESAAVDLVDLVLQHGGEVRVADAPSWFTVYRGGPVGGTGWAVMPETWGDTFDGYCRRTRRSSPVWSLRTLFDLCWEHAAPWPGGGRASRTPPPVASGGSGTRAVLALMADGLLDEEIAERLGTTSRTVRRRVAAAMVEAGVETRFQLGCWWSTTESAER